MTVVDECWKRLEYGQIERDLGRRLQPEGGDTESSERYKRARRGRGGHSGRGGNLPLAEERRGGSRVGRGEARDMDKMKQRVLKGSKNKFLSSTWSCYCS